MTQDQAADAQAWARQFDVTVEQIEDAIRAVGADKAAVEMYLKGSHSTTDAELTRRAGG